MLIKRGNSRVRLARRALAASIKLQGPARTGYYLIRPTIVLLDVIILWSGNHSQLCRCIEFAVNLIQSKTLVLPFSTAVSGVFAAIRSCFTYN